jgi:hypothetical protein
MFQIHLNLVTESTTFLSLRFVWFICHTIANMQFLDEGGLETSHNFGKTEVLQAVAN